MSISLNTVRTAPLPTATKTVALAPAAEREAIARFHTLGLVDDGATYKQLSKAFIKASDHLAKSMSTLTDKVAGIADTAGTMSSAGAKAMATRIQALANAVGRRNPVLKRSLDKMTAALKSAAAGTAPLSYGQVIGTVQAIEGELAKAGNAGVARLGSVQRAASKLIDGLSDQLSALPKGAADAAKPAADALKDVGKAGAEVTRKGTALATQVGATAGNTAVNAAIGGIGGAMVGLVVACTPVGWVGGLLAGLAFGLVVLLKGPNWFN